MTQVGRLQGQACLIVGGTSGIGLATAQRFLAEGAAVVIAGRSEESGRQAIDQLSPLGPVTYVAADSSKSEEVIRLFREAARFLGDRLDILYHVAGVSGRRFGDGPLHECTEAGWDTVLDTNARGMFLTNRAAVNQMLGQPVSIHGLRGTVLNIGSVLGWSPAPHHFGTFAYAASKGAIRAMTLAAAARYASNHIRFNIIAPGLIETPMAQRAATDPDILSYLATKQPIAGGPGTADDCAEAALYLCEPASHFVTGAVLNVDGGWCVSEGRVTERPPHNEPNP